IAAQPIEVLRGLAKRHFTDEALRQRELAERDNCYRMLARTLPPRVSGYAMASLIRATLMQYRDRGAWRFERDREPPADPVRALMYRILTLDDGAIRARSTIERALA